MQQLMLALERLKAADTRAGLAHKAQHSSKKVEKDYEEVPLSIARSCFDILQLLSLLEAEIAFMRKQLASSSDEKVRWRCDGRQVMCCRTTS